MLSRLVLSKATDRPLQRLLSSRHRIQSLRTSGETVNANDGSQVLSANHRRAIALLLFASTSLSIAAYHLQPSRRVRLDTDASPAKLRIKSGLKDRFLQESSESFLPNSRAGFARFDFAQVGSNEPVEDYHSELFIPSAPDGSYWSFFSILDGHSGFQTAEWLSHHLLPSVSRALQSSSNTEDQDKVITQTFVALDDEIVNQSAALVLSTPPPPLSKGLKILERAKAGSCAIMAFFSTSSEGARTLKVANTGDCRAILGRKTTSSDGETMYVVESLSNDHDGRNPAEVARLDALHPGETLWSTDGWHRFIGWGPTRAFGDGKAKWTREIQEKLKKDWFGSTVRDDAVKTPPYFTAEPEIVTTTKIGEGDFMVLATDGLWECLNNEEVVGLVGAWLDQDRKGDGAEMVRLEVDKLPVQMPEKKEGEKTPFTRYAQWGRPKKFVLAQGDSSAQHLMRNALGGEDEDLRKALMGLRTPLSRNFRDDISITVVVF